jgi:Fic family protein
MIEIPLRISAAATGKLGNIERLLGNWEGGLKDPAPPLKQQHSNRLKTLFGTVALSGSSLSLELATDILEGKRELAMARDVLELENASLAYERLASWDPLQKGHLLEAHRLLMHLLSPDAGRFRSKRAQEATHSRLRFLREELDLSPVVAAIFFHHELAAIRPFADGNGRIGRLWLRVLLRRSAAVFEHAPVEEVLLAHRSAYETALASTQRGGAFDAFLEPMLDLLLLALQKLAPQLRGQSETLDDRLARAKAQLGRRWFSRKDYLAFFPKLSTASASRDLVAALYSDTVSARGERRLTEYRFR